MEEKDKYEILKGKGWDDDKINRFLNRLGKDAEERIAQMKRAELYLEKLKNDVVAKMMKKEELEDGAWYEGPDNEGFADHFQRYITEAQWDEKIDQFRVPGQQQFGMDGWLDYFGDVLDANVAGFAPIKKIEK